MRNPQPLVEPDYVPSWDYSIYRTKIAESAETQGIMDEYAIDGVTAREDITEGSENQVIEAEVMEATDEANGSFSSGISVFDSSVNVPQDLQINDVLDLMTADRSDLVSDDIENIIEESAILKGEISPKVPDIRDDMDQDDLEDLVAALPKTKIDFAQESEAAPDDLETISPMAKELLGEDFDFEQLEKQAKESFKFLAPAPVQETDAEDLPEVVLDIQEDASGTVQVSSPFLFAASPQFADLAVPQTILPTFSDDWIQETNNVVESVEGDASNFCFTEEMQPMLVRKKKRTAP